MKAYAGLEMNDQLHLPPTLPPGKNPMISTEQEAGWALEPVQTLWRKISCPSQELKYNSSVSQAIT
jgi:hypothetical protein